MTSTDWCATVWDYDEIIALRPYCSYLLYGDEVCPDTGKQHYQTFFQLKTKRSLQQLKLIIPTAHIERVRGSTEENQIYCMKDGAFTQYGQVKDRPGQGHRTDIESFVEDAKVLDRRSMWETHAAQMVRYARAYDDVSSTFAQPRANGSTIFWIFGPPGTGKSSYVTQKYPARYAKDPADHWWPGYTQQETVVIDELTSAIPFSTLLKIGDPGVLTVPTKGGHTVFSATRVFITTNLEPQNIYIREWLDRAGALCRRSRFFRCDRTEQPRQSKLSECQWDDVASKWVPTGSEVVFTVQTDQMLLDL